MSTYLITKGKDVFQVDSNPTNYDLTLSKKHQTNLENKNPSAIVLRHLRTGKQMTILPENLDHYSDYFSKVALKNKSEQKRYAVVADTNYIEGAEKFEANLSDQLYRGSIGRISSLARMPIYALGALLLTTMVLIALPLSFIATPLNYFLNNPDLDKISLSNVVKTALLAVELFDRALHSSLCFVFAPPKNDLSLDAACLKTFEIVLTDIAKDQTLSVEAAFNKFLERRESLSKAIIG